MISGLLSLDFEIPIPTGSSSEVETNTSSLQAQQQHLGGVRVPGLEGRHHFRPHHVAHGAIQPHHGEEVLTEEWLEDGEEGGKL